MYLILFNVIFLFFLWGVFNLIVFFYVGEGVVGVFYFMYLFFVGGGGVGVFNFI